MGCSKNGQYENFPKADSLYQTVEDPDKLDALRKSVGLIPIGDYLEIVKQQGVEIIYDKTKAVKDFE